MYTHIHTTRIFCMLTNRFAICGEARLQFEAESSNNLVVLNSVVVVLYSIYSYYISGCTNNKSQND